MKDLKIIMHLINNIMENFNDTNTPLFSFNGLNGMSRIVDITDGDTIKAIINFKDNYYKIIVRLNDIDTCETKSKCEENKNLGIDAKKRLYNLITDKTIDGNDKKLIKQELLNNCYLVYLKCYDFDKYGRVLGDIYKNENENNSFSSILINEKLAYTYGGKTKLTEKEQLDLLK
jgi:endonuclease YncB( thermonuclease family)